MEIDAFGDVWCGCAWEMVTDQMVGGLGPSLRWDDGIFWLPGDSRSVISKLPSDLSWLVRRV